MLDAAAALFAEKGFERTSLSDIIERSGGSRTTLYQMFGDKEGLFEAMVSEACKKVVAPLEETAIEGRSPEDVLLNFGYHIAEYATAIETQALIKILAVDGHRLPHIIENFFGHGFDLVRKRMTIYMEGLARDPRYDVPEPEIMAILFLSMVDGQNMFRRVYDAPGQNTKEQDRKRVEIATDVLLNGIRRRES